MGMSAATRLLTLSTWVGPSSDSEKVQQDRAERMVRAAISASPAFDGSDVRVYTKGSYPNNTNVRRDSDVDVVVELHDCKYYDFLHDWAARSSSGAPYAGGWSPASWREAVQTALVDQFGAAAVDAGNIALNVAAVPGSRPSADVVPSFAYERYDDPQERVTHQGSCVFPADGGRKIVNWPAQQLANGQALNAATGQRYKKYVRALKNAENTLVAAGVIEDLPSYFMECLVYNVPRDVLTLGDLDEGFAATLVNLWQRLDDGSAFTDFEEPNGLQWLFKGQADKWTVKDAKGLVAETWNYLGYGD